MTFEAKIERAHYGHVTALERISLKGESGYVVGILGSNGAGKTTALRAIIGTISSEFRQVTLENNDLSKLSVHLLARKGINFCPDGAWCFQNMTVFDNLYGVYVVNRPRRVKATLLDSLLEEVFQLFPILKERRDQISATLSGGERKMLAIGRVLMNSPKVLLLDEPSSGLAPIIVKELYRAISKIKKAGRSALILSEQNAEIALKISDYCMVIEQGRVVLEGRAIDVSNNPEIRKAYIGL